MRLKSSMEKIPGGMMIIPMFLAAGINTLLPDLLRIGNFTEALFVNGTLPLIGLFLLCSGAQINFKKAGSVVGKGFTLLSVKWLVGAVFGLIAFIFAGENGLFLGMAPLAIIAAMTNSNGGLYVAITSQFGSKNDKAAYGILALNDGPFLTMMALSIVGSIGFIQGMFSFIDFLAVLLPIIIGIILGNLDYDMKEFLSKGSDMLIPFMAFAIGMSIDFKDIFTGGMSGILLGVLTVFLTGTTCYIVFKIIGWNPIVGAAEGSTGGNAVATPTAIAAASPAFSDLNEIATAQVAASVVTTAILLPIYVSYLVKRIEKKEKLDKEIIEL